MQQQWWQPAKWRAERPGNIRGFPMHWQDNQFVFTYFTYFLHTFVFTYFKGYIFTGCQVRLSGRNTASWARAFSAVVTVPILAPSCWFGSRKQALFFMCRHMYKEVALDVLGQWFSTSVPLVLQLVCLALCCFLNSLRRRLHVQCITVSWEVTVASGIHDRRGCSWWKVLHSAEVLWAFRQKQIQQHLFGIHHGSGPWCVQGPILVFFL